MPSINGTPRWLLRNGRSRSTFSCSFLSSRDNAGVSDRYVSHLLPLAFLAPRFVEAILAGNQPVDLTTEILIKRTDLPLDWSEQKALLGFD